MIFFDLFSRDSDLIELKSGDVLFREGEIGDYMYVLVNGTAEISVGGKPVEQLGHGAIAGEMAVIERSPRSATVTATSDCMLARIDEKRFNYLVSHTPHFSVEVMRVMADRLRRADARV